MQTYAVKNRVLFLLAVAVTGAAAGSAIWAFFFLMNLGLGLLWTVLPNHIGFAAFPIVLCAAGGIVVGLVQKHVGDQPEELNEVMHTVKVTGRYPYDKLGRTAAAALAPLVFGGSIGPEAGLTGIIAGLCTWVGERMRRFGVDFQELTRLGMSAALSAIFAAPLYGFVAPLAGDPTRDEQIVPPKRRKAVLYAVAVIGALAPFVTLQTLFGRAGGLPHFDGMSIGQTELLWAIPLLIVGATAGWFYHGFDRAARALAGLFGSKIVARAVFAGLALGAIGVALPFVMFSGEHQLTELANEWTGMAAIALLATGVLKLFLTPLCIHCGWRGGTIFPLVFSGACLGYAVASVSGCDAVFCVAVTAAAVCGGAMRNPVMAALLLVLCFPVTALPATLLAAAVGSAVPLPHAWRRGANEKGAHGPERNTGEDETSAAERSAQPAGGRAENGGGACPTDANTDARPATRQGGAAQPKEPR